MKPTPEYIELAREMKEMGFPQPEHKEWQMWVAKSEYIFAIKAIYSDLIEIYCNNGHGMLHVAPSIVEEAAYLPTAEDIIRDAKDRLGEVNFINMYADNVFWVVTEKRNNYDLASESMVVALARTWLEAAKLNPCS